MLSVPEQLKNILKNDRFPMSDTSTPKDLEITFDGMLPIHADQVVDDSFSLSESIVADDDIRFGSCIASQIKFKLANVPEELKGREFTIDYLIGNEYVIPLGKYKVQSAKLQDDLIFKEVVAYDKLKDTDADVSSWYNGLFPTGNETYTLKQFRSSLLAYLGIEEIDQTLPNDDMIVEKTIDPTQISGRTVLEATVELNGAFGHINRQGKFVRKVLQPGYGLYPSETLYPSEDLYPVAETDTSYVQEDIIADTINKAMYESVRFEEYTVKEIDKLIIRAEEDDIGAIVGGDQKRVIDTQTGTSIQSTKSDDSVVEIQKIEGASRQVVTVQGKNLIDYTKASNIRLTTLNILADGEISASGKKDYCRFDFSLPLALKGKTVSGRYTILEDTTVTKSIRLYGKKEDNSSYWLSMPNGGKVTIPTDAKTIIFQFMINNTATVLETDVVLRVKDIQLEEGSTATPYEPFTPNSPSPEYPSSIINANNFNIVASNGSESNQINIPYELASLPNGVKDTIEYIGNGKGRLTQRVGKAVFDGSDDEIWNIVSADTSSYYLLGNIPNANIYVNSEVIPNLLCNKFKTYSYNNLTITTRPQYGISNRGNASSQGIAIRVGSIKNSLSDLKVWLQANPIEVYYELATPIITEIDLPPLTSYKGVTNIYTTANPQVNLTVDFYVNPINTYIIEGNFLVFGKSAVELEQIALNAFGNMAKRPYRPYEAQSIGLPYIEVGDSLEYATDDVVHGYVLQRTLTGIQSLWDEIEAPGSEEREQNFGVNKEIIQLQGRTAILKRTVDEVSNTLTDLAEDTESRFIQTAELISQSVGDLDQQLTGELNVLAGQVVLKVDSNGNVGYIDLIGDPDTELTSIKFKADNLELEGLTTINGKFKVLLDGSIEVVDAKVRGTITGSIIRGSEIETYGNEGFFKSTSWDGETYGVFQNEILINDGVLRCSRTLYASGGATYDWETTINYDTVKTKKIVCDTINGKAPIVAGDFISRDTFYALYNDLNFRVSVLEGG